MVSIYDIALKSHVSLATVSRALDPVLQHKVKAETRRRILEICDELHYRPRASARAFASGRTSRIALILGNMQQDMMSPVFAEFMTGLGFGVQRNGYTLTIHAVDYHLPDCEERLKEFLLSSQADCYIMGNALVSSGNIDLIQGLERPVISLNHHSCSGFAVPSIITDDTAALKELIGRIPRSWAGESLFIGARNSSGDDFNLKFKWQQICGAVKELGLPADFFRCASYDCAGEKLFLNRFQGMRYAEENLSFLKQFRFIWCYCDFCAQGVCDALERAGIRPGKDIMIAGFDNIERVCQLDHPFLSTIDYRMMERGQQTADLIAEMLLSGRKITRSVVSESVYVERQSFRGTAVES